MTNKKTTFTFKSNSMFVTKQTSLSQAATAESPRLARRQGCSVRLIEAHSCLGGMGTAGMVPAFMQFSDGINFLPRHRQKFLTICVNPAALCRKMDWHPRRVSSGSMTTCWLKPGSLYIPTMLVDMAGEK